MKTMAKILGKDPFLYEKERDSFLSEVQQFHASRGTPFVRQPSIGGKEVDLYLLFTRISSLGGFDKIPGIAVWEEVAENYGIPKFCTNGAQAIKQFYQRYLYLYEKVSKGEDPDQREEGDEPTAKRKKIDQFFSTVPNKYNHQQHIVSNTVRRNLGLSTDFARKDPYEKLEKALLSGLPNEVDFAINVCTLLSNEGKHILNVSNNPRLIEILMAHAGIFGQGPGSLFTLHHEGWKLCTRRNFEMFWMDSVEDREVRGLLSPLSLFESDKGEKLSKESVLGEKSEYEDVRDNVLHMGPDLGVHNVEGQRILQLAMIIRNLSFEEENMAFLASNLLIFRFLMLCIHNKYWTLKQLGLDTISNLAIKMELDPLDYPTTQLVLGVVTRCISSPDRFEVVRGLEILARLCQVVNNWDTVSENLEHKVYEDIVNLLTVHDIQLIVFTLETLYHLSELGEVPSNHMAKVQSSIDTLVHMVTIEAQAYGPNSLLGIKVVEHVPAGGVTQQQPGAAHQQRLGAPSRQLLHTPGRLPGTPQPPPAVATPPRPATSPTPPGQLHRPGAAPTPPPTAPPFRKGSLATPPQPGVQPGLVNTPSRPGISHCQRPGVSPQAAGIRPNMPPGYMVHRNLVNRTRHQAPVVNQAECDAIAVAWLHAYYEVAPASVAVKNEVYAEYLATCSRFTIKNALNSMGFSECIKTAFPQIHQNRIEREDGTLEMQLIGIMRRSSPHAFPPPPKRLVTGYVSTPGGIKPVVQYTTSTSSAPSLNLVASAGTRPATQPRPPPVLAAVAPPPGAVPAVAPLPMVVRPAHEQGTVVIRAQGLPLAAPPAPIVLAPLCDFITAAPDSSSQITEPVSMSVAQEEEAMDTDVREVCLPVNRPPSRRRSCSGSVSPPRSPRTRSPRSKSPRPHSPKPTRQSPRFNSDMSHAQMERIDDQLTTYVQETAIEKVENPAKQSRTDAAEREGPTTRRRSGESRANQNGNLTKVNGGRSDPSSKTSDESHPPHINGDVLSPAPSDSSSATADPLSPKRNGAAPNPATSPSILDKKAKIAQLLQDTAAAKEALGLGQNGVVTHFGNGDCVVDNEGGLPSAEGLTKQVSEAAALMPETNGCDDDYLGNSTDGANDHLCDSEDVTALGYSVDGTNDNLQGDAERRDNNAVTSHGEEHSSATQTVIPIAQPSQLQGSTSDITTATILEQTIHNVTAADQSQAQEACAAFTHPAAPTTQGLVQEDAITSGSAAVTDLLQRKLVNKVQQPGAVEDPQEIMLVAAPRMLPQQVNLVPVRNPTPQSHLMQQLQIRLQRPIANTQQEASMSTVTVLQGPCQTSQPQVDASHIVHSDSTAMQSLGSVPVATTTHAAVQQQLLQRLRAPHLVQQQAQQPGVFQPRLQAPQNLGGSTIIIVQGQLPQQQQESHSRPPSTGPPSGPPSRPPSTGPSLAHPPSTSPAPLPSPSGSDASTLPPASPPPTGQLARRPSTASTASNDSKAAVKAKKRKVQSNSIESRCSSNASVLSEVQYMCEWNNCNTFFDSAKAVNAHVVKEHVSQLPLQGVCPWETCDGLRRGKWSLLTHVQDRHLTEAALKASAGKRQQQQQPPPPNGSSTSSSSTPTSGTQSGSSGTAPVYPQDAALQAIRRFAPRPPYPELGEMKEGPVTKHIRLTSALILRNIAKYSSYGRSLLKRHESHLACMALSAVEASTALSHVLAELEHHTLTSPAAKPESDAEDDASSADNDSDAESDQSDIAETTDLDLSQEVLAH